MILNKKQIKSGDFCYTINNNPEFILSGDIHYFRVPRDAWANRLQLLKKAGGNAVATYIPWLVHEPTEGEFDFSGNYDLDAFLTLAKEMDLAVIVKPGPYQYSELIYQGLPGWLINNYPEIHALDISGNKIADASVSYLHPVFLEKVSNWYNAVCPILNKHLPKNGGSVVMAQLDNELGGIHFWFSGPDYNPAVVQAGDSKGRFTRFLQHRFSNIEHLNKCYGASFKNFIDVRPDDYINDKITNIACFKKDFIEFCMETYAEYLQFLSQEMTRHGIDILKAHNSGAESMNSLFDKATEEMGDNFVLGSDHYYNLNQNWIQNSPSPQYAMKCFLSFEQLRLMKSPPTVFEIPGGSSSEWPPINSLDALSCYMTNLAMGMKAANYYVFTGGINPDKNGSTGDVYDYSAGISPDGLLRPLYFAQKEFGEFILSHKWLAGATKEADFKIAIDFAAPQATYYKDSAYDNAVFPVWDVWEFLRRGIVSSAFCCGLSPRLTRLRDLDVIDAFNSEPVVIVTSDSMQKADQQRIIDFYESGGKVLLLPVVPFLDENFKPCTILKDYLGLKRQFRTTSNFGRYSIFNYTNLPAMMTKQVFFEFGNPKVQVTGKDELSGNILSWQLCNDKKGMIASWGYIWNHTHKVQSDVLSLQLNKMGAKPKIKSNNNNLLFSVLSDRKHSLLFVINLFSQKTSVSLKCETANGTIKLENEIIQPFSVKTFEAVSVENESKYHDTNDFLPVNDEVELMYVK